MKRRFSEEQIIGVLREQEAGVTVKEITRRHGVSEQSFYRWKAKYGGLALVANFSRSAGQTSSPTAEWSRTTLRHPVQP